MSESIAEKKRRAGKILKLLYRDYGSARCALVHSNPLELLVATILSAQCTDVRVNIVTKELFRKYRTAKDYAGASLKAFEQEVRSTGFYRNKAKNILATAKMLVEKYQGYVPRSMDELLELPGVARKTANVVLGTAYGIASGVVVDTHVRRISHRLGLSDQDDPKKVERDLQELIPRKSWIQFSHRVIWHGRKVCSARKPDCDRCTLNKLCPSAFKAVPRGTPR